MIETIKIIKSIPFKENSVLKGLKTLNIIFGYNGSGKTTFTRLINDPKKLKIYPPKQENGNNEREFLIFNKDFINDNFYKEDSDNLDSHENFVSEANKNIIVKLNKIENDYLDLTKKLPQLDITKRTNFWKLINDFKKMHSKKYSDDELDGYISLFEKKIINLIDEEIRKTVRKAISGKIIDFCNTKITSQKSNVKKWDELKTQLLKMTANDSVSEINNFYNKIGSSISNDFLEKIKLLKVFHSTNKIIPNSSSEKFILNLHKESKGFLKWFEKALSISKDKKLGNKCLLCQEETFDQSKFDNIIKYLNKVENDAFNDLKETLEQKELIFQEDEQIKNTIIQKMKDWDIDDVENEEIKLDKLFKEYRDCFQNIEDCFNNIKNLKQFEIEKLDLEINVKIEKLNTKIENINSKIQKAKTIKDKKIKKLSENILLNMLNPSYLKYNEVKQLVSNYRAVKNIAKKCKSLTDDYSKEREKLVFDEKIINEINHILEEYCNFHFRLRASQKEEKYFYKVITLRDDSEMKKTKLSDGERAVLSFIYFLLSKCESKINDQNKKKDFIIVIDDPTTSLTEENSDAMGSVLLEKIEQYWNQKYKVQYFLLSHKFNFLYQFSKRLVFFKNGLIENEDFKYGTWIINQQIIERNKNCSESSFKKHQSHLFSIYRQNWKDYKKLKEDNSDFIIGNTMRRILDGFVFFWSKKQSFCSFLNSEFKNDSKKIKKYQKLYNTLNKYSHTYFLDTKTEQGVFSDIKDAKTCFEQFFDEEYKVHYKNMMDEEN